MSTKPFVSVVFLFLGISDPTSAPSGFSPLRPLPLFCLLSPSIVSTNRSIRPFEFFRLFIHFAICSIRSFDLVAIYALYLLFTSTSRHLDIYITASTPCRSELRHIQSTFNTHHTPTPTTTLTQPRHAAYDIINLETKTSPP